MSKIQIGDLVRLLDSFDQGRRIGVVVGISPRQAHLVSLGTTVVVQVYWPVIGETDWEYDFFLEKLEEPDLTKDKE